jgi:hypothetical protein
VKRIGLHSVAEYQAAADEVRRTAVATNDLERLFLEHAGRGTSKWWHYLEIYDRYFAPLRDGFPAGDGARRPLRFLEIGVSFGGSLQLWRKYFGPDAVIAGIDRDPSCASVDDPDLIVRVGSQDDREFVESVVHEMGGVDVVVDDGSHRARASRGSFEFLFPRLPEGGLYLIEDVHTAYWRRRYGGGYRRRGTAIEMAKDLVDAIHRRYFRRAPRTHGVDPNDVYSVAFFDSVIVIEKRHRDAPIVVTVGDPSFSKPR